MPGFIPIIILALLIAALVCQSPRPTRYILIEGLDSGDSSGGDGGNDSGATYQNPGLGSDPKALARKNAANISVLQKQVEKYSGLTQEVHDLSGNVHKTAHAVVSLNQQLSKCNESQKSPSTHDG
jgi:hypothetical protein